MNLLSTFDINELGYDVILKSNGSAEILDEKTEVVSTIPLGPGKVFSVQGGGTSLCNAVRRTTMSFVELHQTLGHTRPHLLKRMIRRNCFPGLTITNINDPFECAHCRMCKSTDPPHDTVASRKARFAGDIISADVIDLRAHPSIDGCKFVSVLVDHYTYITSTRPLPQKDAVSVKNHLEEFECALANITNRQIRTLRSDQGTEYDNDTMRRYTSSNGTTHEFANLPPPGKKSWGFIEKVFMVTWPF